MIVKHVSSRAARAVHDREHDFGGKESEHALAKSHEGWIV
jgi:hypothetical protein